MPTQRAGLSPECCPAPFFPSHALSATVCPDVHDLCRHTAYGHIITAVIGAGVLR